MYFISLARRKSLPSIHCFPGPLLIFLGFTSSSSFAVESSSHGTVRKGFRSAAALCLPLLRPDRHQRLFERIVSARASGSFLSPSDRSSHPEQGVLAQRTNDYHNWVEAFAANHQIPIQWAEKGVSGLRLWIPPTIIPIMTT